MNQINILSEKFLFLHEDTFFYLNGDTLYFRNNNNYFTIKSQYVDIIYYFLCVIKKEKKTFSNLNFNDSEKNILVSVMKLLVQRNFMELSDASYKKMYNNNLDLLMNYFKIDESFKNICIVIDIKDIYHDLKLIINEFGFKNVSTFNKKLQFSSYENILIIDDISKVSSEFFKCSKAVVIIGRTEKNNNCYFYLTEMHPIIYEIKNTVGVLNVIKKDYFLIVNLMYHICTENKKSTNVVCYQDTITKEIRKYELPSNQNNFIKYTDAFIKCINDKYKIYRKEIKQIPLSVWSVYFSNEYVINTFGDDHKEARDNAYLTFWELFFYQYISIQTSDIILISLKNELTNLDIIYAYLKHIVKKYTNVKIDEFKILNESFYDKDIEHYLKLLKIMKITFKAYYKKLVNSTYIIKLIWGEKCITNAGLSLVHAYINAIRLLVYTVQVSGKEKKIEFINRSYFKYTDVSIDDIDFEVQITKKNFKNLCMSVYVADIRSKDEQ